MRVIEYTVTIVAVLTDVTHVKSATISGAIDIALFQLLN